MRGFYAGRGSTWTAFWPVIRGGIFAGTYCAVAMRRIFICASWCWRFIVALALLSFRAGCFLGILSSAAWPRFSTHAIFTAFFVTCFNRQIIGTLS